MIFSQKKFLVCGNVDDGKSTFLGKFFYDAGLLYEDQVDKLKTDSYKKGLDHLDYSLVFDGLENEFNNGITINNSYKYFYMGKDKYIFIDTPGHDEYLGSMASAASFVDSAIIVIDILKGISTQALKHLFIFSEFKIKNLIILCNKMDLVNFDKSTFYKLVQELDEILSKFDFRYEIIPISAFYGDNIIKKSHNTDWYYGDTLFESIQKINLVKENNQDCKLFVQKVVVNKDKIYAFGFLESGVINVKNKYLLNNINSIQIDALYDQKQRIEAAEEGMSICVEMSGDLHLKRGDVIHSRCYDSISNRYLNGHFISFNNNLLECEKEFFIKRSFLYERVKFHSFSNIEELSIKSEMKTINNIFKVEFSLYSTSKIFLLEFEESKTSGYCNVIDENYNTVGILLIKQKFKV